MYEYKASWVRLSAVCALGSAALLALGNTDAIDPAIASASTFTTLNDGPSAYTLPAPVLTAPQTQIFAHGREAFRQRWVLAPAIGGPWGLGPTSNADTCIACHDNNGRGRAPDNEREALRSLLVRLSVPGRDEHGGPKPHPAYGEQLNEIGIEDRTPRIPAEGHAAIRYAEREITFADGESIGLRTPTVAFTWLNFGELGAETMVSLRVAPAVYGLGLLEAVAEQTLKEIAAKQPAQGVSGKLNYVWDRLRGERVLGRFGLKANQPSLKQQVAAAFHGDLGVTSEFFQRENCTEAQKQCLLSLPGGSPEVTSTTLNAIEFYLRALAVPARRNIDDPQVKRGEQLFAAANCAACHVPELTTGDYAPLPAASNLTIRAYSDLLLHDLGEGLADNRPDFEADGREWRTAPLWGIGLSAQASGHSQLLHDGRARNIAEAILWHGGEAEQSREAFRNMVKDDRVALMKFVESL